MFTSHSKCWFDAIKLLRVRKLSKLKITDIFKEQIQIAVSDMLSMSMSMLGINNDEMQGRTATTDKRFWVKIFSQGQDSANKNKPPSINNQILLIFICGAFYSLVTPKMLKQRNNFDNFIGKRCLEALWKVDFCKNSKNVWGKWSSCCTYLAEFSA